MENIREIVLNTLLALERGEDFSNKLLKAVLDKYDYLDNRDKAFIKRVTDGTVERKIELDYYIDAYSTVPVRKMKPLIRCLMRMSVYQIVYMDSVPDSAVVNEACKLAIKRKFQNLKGFVNAVLRKVASNKDSLMLPDKIDDPKKYLSVKYSMPDWIVEKWLNIYDFETVETILKGLLDLHPVSLRFRTDIDDTVLQNTVSKIKEQGVEPVKSKYLPFVYTATDVNGVSSLYGYDEGLFTVQDVSSALSVMAAGIKQGDEVLDICAAPGGKSLLAAEFVGEKGHVVSRDISDAKVEIIRENADRMKASNIEVQVFDATETDNEMINAKDVVIMDVPCSGLGVMGKKSDIKYRVTQDGIDSLLKLQREIIDKSIGYVKPGGTLLYSTCTINPDENQNMVKYICENYPFKVEPVDADILGTLVLKDDTSFGVQILPGYMECDGFFFAKLKRYE